MSLAEVRLWGRTIGAVSWDLDRSLAHFEYHPDFLDSAIDVSPIHMPREPKIYSFPELPRPTFHGLPGLLADALPDKFGNRLINAWLAAQGRTPESFNPVERLCYIGKRGMGALEFEPTQGPKFSESRKLEVDALVRLAGEILAERRSLEGSLGAIERAQSLTDMLRIGTSAGGARAKAVISWNQETQEVRSGQVPSGEGFSYWMIKFDGVSGNRDRDLEDPRGYGRIEYAYHLMAQDVGIDMMPCRLLEENGRAHFLTQRFDRTAEGKKIHMQSLAGLAHFDFNDPGSNAYEEAFGIMQRLNMSRSDLEQAFLRMVFNIVARNQDDHVKNMAFLMDRAGHWRLSPAYDVTYSYNPAGTWTSQHQMSMNGKRDGFVLDDFKDCGKVIALKRGQAAQLVERVCSVLQKWTRYADKASVAPGHVKSVQDNLRLDLLTS